jgi:hypothetical protein
MFQSEIKTGELLKYMSRVILVLDDKKGQIDGVQFDGFVLGLEVGCTIPAQYNVSALEPLNIIEKNK